MVDHTPPPLSGTSKVLRLSAIAVVVAALAGAFGYVSGRLDPQRLTPGRIVDTLEHNSGHYPGLRRNHAKGVCVAGYFESSNEARPYSIAKVFSEGSVPVEGRFALPGGNPYAPDSSVPIRSLGLRFILANGQQWRTGMNSMPVFPVSTPWVKTAKPSASYATESYNALNAFYLVNAAGQRQAVRWGFVPVSQDEPGAVAPAGADFLEKDLVQRLAAGPLKWQLRMTLANPGDPIDDASKAWTGEHKVLNAGTLVLESTQPQDSGDCRDINYDPLVLPSGIEASADPLLAARSAAYASSYLRRTSEVGQLPAAHAQQESRP